MDDSPPRDPYRDDDDFRYAREDTPQRQDTPPSRHSRAASASPPRRLSTSPNRQGSNEMAPDTTETPADSAAAADEKQQPTGIPTCPGKTKFLQITNIDRSLSDEHIVEIFSLFIKATDSATTEGDSKGVKVRRRRERSGIPMEECTLEFRDEDDAAMALEHMNTGVINGRDVTCRHVNENIVSLLHGDATAAVKPAPRPKYTGTWKRVDTPVAASGLVPAAVQPRHLLATRRGPMNEAHEAKPDPHPRDDHTIALRRHQDDLVALRIARSPVRRASSSPRRNVERDTRHNRDDRYEEDTRNKRSSYPTRRDRDTYRDGDRDTYRGGDRDTYRRRDGDRNRRSLSRRGPSRERRRNSPRRKPDLDSRRGHQPRSSYDARHNEAPRRRSRRASRSPRRREEDRHKRARSPSFDFRR